jgi:hypothetical protein
VGREPTPLDAIASITVTLFGDGQMQIHGAIGDVRLAQQMLDHARDAITAQWRNRSATGGLLLPASDVEVEHHPEFPVTFAGDR